MEQEKADDKKAKEYNITVDNKPFKWVEPTITGAQIKALVKADPSYGVWLVVKGPAEDEEIADTQGVDLTQQGKEKFITGPKKSTEGVFESMGKGLQFIRERQAMIPLIALSFLMTF